MSQPGKFMVAVGAIIAYKDTEQILLLKRSADKDFAPGIWEDVTGRMHQFEEPEDALRREVEEETGLQVSVIKPLNVFHIFRGEETAENELVGIVYRCRSESKEIRLSDEHSAYKRISAKKALESVDNKGIQKDIEAFIHDARKGKKQKNI